MAKTLLNKLEEKIAKANDKATRAANEAKALKAKAAEIKRKEETKMKILYGAAVMKMFEDDDGLKQRVDGFLPTFLTRDADRALFGLPKLPKTPKA